MLEKNRLITTMGNKYGTLYFPSNLLEQNMDIFKEIVEKKDKK